MTDPVRALLGEVLHLGEGLADDDGIDDGHQSRIDQLDPDEIAQRVRSPGQFPLAEEAVENHGVPLPRGEDLRDDQGEKRHTHYFSHYTRS